MEVVPVRFPGTISRATKADMAQFTTIPWVSRAVAVVAFLVLPLVSAVSASSSAWAAGTISVSFLYMPPSQIEPTYHTAIWLEDLNGRLVKTLRAGSRSAMRRTRRRSTGCTAHPNRRTVPNSSATSTPNSFRDLPNSQGVHAMSGEKLRRRDFL